MPHPNRTLALAQKKLDKQVRNYNKSVAARNKMQAKLDGIARQIEEQAAAVEKTKGFIKRITQTDTDGDIERAPYDGANE